MSVGTRKIAELVEDGKKWRELRRTVPVMGIDELRDWLQRIDAKLGRLEFWCVHEMDKKNRRRRR